LDTYCSCFRNKEKVVSALCEKPIDYKSVNFIQEALRLTEADVDAVLDKFS
jgi:hypothetical protein